ATEVPAQPPGVVFLFPGGGVQHANMGLDLYRDGGVFRQEVDRCCELLQAETGWDLRQWLFPAPGEEVEADAALSAMDKAQPALFVIGYALARMWMARGVQPVSMLGHSLGEYVAACLAGVFELPYALRIVAARGRLLQSLPQGAMTSVPLAEAELQSLLDAGCDLGAVNGERLCVLSGPLAAIEAA
ncbi:acyltransferase domain-containing protein, partial [Delftia tsuruhatensis]